MPTKITPKVREIPQSDLFLYTPYLRIVDIGPDRNDGGELELVLLPKQKYGNPPTALQNFNDLITGDFRFIHHIPGRMRGYDEITPKFIGSIIVMYHTICCDPDSVRGFRAIRFNDDKSHDWFFVPLEARIGSRYFALCQK